MSVVASVRNSGMSARRELAVIKVLLSNCKIKILYGNFKDFKPSNFLKIFYDVAGLQSKPLHIVFRQEAARPFTLMVPLSTQVYK